MDGGNLCPSWHLACRLKVSTLGPQKGLGKPLWMRRWSRERRVDSYFFKTHGWQVFLQ